MNEMPCWKHQTEVNIVHGLHNLNLEWIVVLENMLSIIFDMNYWLSIISLHTLSLYEYKYKLKAGPEGEGSYCLAETHNIKYFQ